MQIINYRNSKPSKLAISLSALAKYQENFITRAYAPPSQYLQELMLLLVSYSLT